MAGTGNQYQPPAISDQYLNVSQLLAPPQQAVWDAFIAMLTAVTEVLGELNQDQYLMILDVAAHLAVSAGEVPYIGSNGNWWLGGTDTGTSANGLPGPQGPQGVPGTPGQGFQILGAYPDLASLQAAHPTGNPGDAYAVGTAPNQAVYIWSNGQWVNIGPILAGLPYIGSAPPPNPAVGNLWFDTVGVQCYIYYNDGTSIQWVPLINQGITTGGGGGGGTAGVSSFNTRTGDVLLENTDVTGVGGALLAGPSFTGVPTAPTATAGTATGQLATTAFVQNAMSSVVSGVSSWNGRSGAVTLTTADITAVGAVTGGPYALIASPALTGTPTAPTATAGTATTQLATTAYVVNSISAISAGVISFNGRSGAVTLTTADITAAGAVTGGPYAIQTNPVGGQNNYAAINSQVFTGTPSLPTGTVGVTQTAGTSNTTIATTGFVNAALTSLPPSGAVINPSPPVSPTVGELWFDSTGLQMYVWYYDGNSYQWVPTINQGAMSSAFAPATSSGPYMTMQSNASNTAVWNTHVGVDAAPMPDDGNGSYPYFARGNLNNGYQMIIQNQSTGNNAATEVTLWNSKAGSTWMSYGFTSTGLSGWGGLWLTDMGFMEASGTGGLLLYADAGPIAINAQSGTSPITFYSAGSQISQYLHGLTVGAPTGGDKGVGTVNATGLFVNGVAVGAAGAPVTNPAGGANNYGPLAGVTNASNAAAGQIGEYVAAQITTQVALSTVNNAVSVIMTMTLTAGDWDVHGGGLLQNTSTAYGFVVYLSSTSSVAGDSQGQGSVGFTGGTGFNVSSWVATTPRRFSSSSSMTVYLLGQPSFTGSQSPTALGTIYARRVR